MCRNKAESGRRCKSSAPQYRSIKRAKDKAERQADHAAYGSRASRRAALVSYGDWMDYTRVFEVSATAHNGTRLDLTAALHSGKPVGPWQVADTFRDRDGDLYGLVRLNPEWLTDEDKVVLFDDVGVESYEGIASLTVDGQSDVAFREGAEDAFWDLRHGRETDNPLPFTEHELGDANARAQMWAEHWERDAARKAEQANKAAERIEGHQPKMQSARAIAAEARKAIKSATTVAELQAAWDNDDVLSLSDKAQSSLYDLYVARRREVAKANKVNA